VKIEGPIVRLVINPALLPSTVRPQGQYRVSFFVRTVDDTRSEHVSSFVPENRMFQVGDIRALRALPRRRV
jgi:hypothetical protein